jgi:subtilisin family serine protease
VLIAVVLIPAAAWGASNDPRFHQQWGLQRVGAEFAWTAATGEGVVIAVVDTGVDGSHEDLQRVLPGRDFVADDDDARDEHGHGTLISGVAAASTNNAKGVASVAPGAEILPVRVIPPEGFNDDPQDVKNGIDYAVQRAQQLGKKLVINLSLDGLNDQNNDPRPLPVIFADPRVDTAIKNAEAAGAAVIIAAGNSGEGRTSYDSDRPGILVVGASDQNDGRWAFSSYGTGLDVLAPGVDIVTTWWAPQHGPNVYGAASGTSISVPFVSGTTALLMSKGLSAAQAADRILKSAKDVGPPGRDDIHGWGILDTAAALDTPRTAANAPSAPSRRRNPSSRADATPTAPAAPVVTPAASAEPSSPPPPKLEAEVSVAQAEPDQPVRPFLWSLVSAALLVVVAAGLVLKKFVPRFLGQ